MTPATGGAKETAEMAQVRTKAERRTDVGVRTRRREELVMLGLAAIGLAAGVFSGLVGIGGGILLVPALVFVFGLTQHQAQGTTLALLVPPIGALGAWTYYKQGYVDLRIAALVAAGFFLGSLLGARYSIGLPDTALARIFGGTVVVIGFKMLIGG